MVQTEAPKVMRFRGNAFRRLCEQASALSVVVDERFLRLRWRQRLTFREADAGQGENCPDEKHGRDEAPHKAIIRAHPASCPPELPRNGRL